MTRITKIVAGSAAALALLPMAASAHSDNGLHIGWFFGKGFHASLGTTTKEVKAQLKADLKGDRDERGLGHDDKKAHATSTAAHASTTATVIVRDANRIKNIADFMSSLSTVLQTRINNAGLSASSTVKANALLSDFNASLGTAKTQANAAISVAGSISASTGTSTLKTLTQQARTDLKAAREALGKAQVDFRMILRILFSA